MNVAPETIRVNLNNIAKNKQMQRDNKRDFHSYYINKKNNDPEWYNNKIKKISEQQKTPEGKAKRRMIYLKRKKLGLTGYKGLTSSRLRSINKRRNIKSKLKENYTDEDMEYTRKLFQNKCALCGATKNLCFDHWYPLSNGYVLSKTNSVLLCRPCNSKKYNKPPTEHLSENVVKRIEDLLYSHGYTTHDSLSTSSKE